MLNSTWRSSDISLFGSSCPTYFRWKMIIFSTITQKNSDKRLGQQWDDLLSETRKKIVKATLLRYIQPTKVLIFSKVIITLYPLFFS